MKAGREPLTLKGSPGPGEPNVLTMDDIKRKGYLNDPDMLAAMDLAAKSQAIELNKRHGTEIAENDYGIKQAVRHELHKDKLADENAMIQRNIIDLAIEKQKKGNIA